MTGATHPYDGVVAGSGDVHVYWLRPCPVPGGEGLLDETERRRLEILVRPRDRQRYIAAHALMRLAVADFAGIAPEHQRFDRTCILCGGAHGKPRLRGIGPAAGLEPHTLPHINFSYAGSYILLALSPVAPVGIDIEHCRATDFGGFATVALTPQEAAELVAIDPAERCHAKATWWVRKEAALKATGHGLRVDTTAVRVTPPDQPPRIVDWTDPDVPCPVLTMADIPLPKAYAAALAVVGAHELRLEHHDASRLVGLRRAG